MEIIVSTDALRRELRVFQNLVLKDSALMEISNLKLETSEDKLFIYGTDMDVSLRAEIDADSFEANTPGVLCLKAHKLIEVLNTLDSKVKSIRIKEEKNGWAALLFGRSHFRISGITAEHFPEVIVEKPANQNENNPTPVLFPAGLLAQFLSSTDFAIATNDTKFTLTGSNLSITREGSRMVATDGFKVAVIEAGIAGTFTALFPKKASSVLLRLLAEIPAETMIELSSDDNRVYATLGAGRFSFRKLTGEFPNVEPLLQMQNKHKVLLSLYDLKGAVKRADLFADRNNQCSVGLTVRPGEMEISAKSFEVGAGTELIDATYDGPEVNLKLNSGHLAGFFNSLNLNETGANPTLSLEFSAEEKKSTVWRVHQEGNVESAYDYRCIITKLR